MNSTLSQPFYLADDTRVTESDEVLVTWIDAKLSEGFADADMLFGAANLLALVLARTKQLALAERLCEREIAVSAHRSAARRASLLHALEAQVNLFRLAALRLRVDEAFAGFS